ncbi:MAG: ankyrin repeat domain-containing protein [Fimbriimonadaceae bacterium]
MPVALIASLIAFQSSQEQKDYKAFSMAIVSEHVNTLPKVVNPYLGLATLTSAKKLNPDVLFKVVKRLVATQEDPNKREEPTKYKNFVTSQPGPTPLHKLAMMSGGGTEPLAAISRHNIYWITKAILTAPSCDPNLLDSDDRQTRDTPLTLYLRWHYEQSGAFLKAMVESPKTDVNKRGGAQQQYPLHAAAWLGRLDWVKLLVEHGAKINIQKENGQTALHSAAMQNTKGNADVITYLLKKGAKADLRSKGAIGYTQVTVAGAIAETPLEIAMRKGFKQIIAVLSQN